MPRNYERKRPELAPVTEQLIAKAKALIQNGKSKRAAASAIGVSESCLRKRLKLNKAATSMGRFKPTFDESQEAEFAVHCKQMDDRYFGLTINDLRRLAFEYAEANNIENRFDKSSKMAGRDWVECFLKRHPQLALRQSAGTSLARAIGFNKTQVERFYKNLKELYEQHKIPPSRIYNMDETGISTVPKKTPKVVTTKGKKVVSKVVSAERGITITAICCMSACGHYVPPALIYPRKRPRDDLLDGGPLQSICMVSDSGFVNTELFINWLHHFKYSVHPTVESPVLLILDNHSSHISLEAIKYARENHIIMLTLPPHGSHKLQPLDRCIYGPLKVKYSIECDKFMGQHPGRGITQYQVARLFNEAYKKVATLGNAESGFKVTGIYPYDDDLFDETDFAPSLVTDQLQGDVEMRESDDQQNKPESYKSPDISERIECSIEKFDQLPMDQQVEIPATETSRNSVTVLEDEVLNVDFSNNYPGDDKTPSPSIIDAIIANSITNVTESSVEDLPAFNSYSGCVINQPSTDKYVPVSQLSPLPHMTEKKQGGRVALKSQVITASPYKLQLEEKKRQEEKKKKPMKKTGSTLSLDAKASKSGVKKRAYVLKTNKNSFKVRPSSSKTKDNEYYCPLCQEKYIDPPTEEWIQCVKCKDWWHELCASQEGENNIFVCDYCSKLI